MALINFVVDTSNTGTTLTGTAGRDILIGLSGGDLLDGGGGSDALLAGSGNDVLIYDQADWLIDGGSGIDTLRFLGNGQTLDLRNNNQIVCGIEQLQLWGGGNHHVFLTAASIKGVSDNDKMVIWGDGSNTVDIGSGWTFAGLSTDGHFEKFTNNGIVLQTELAVTVAGFSKDAVISSPSLSNVNEDSSPTTLSINGSIGVSDNDAGQAYLLSAVDSAAGNLGHLSLTNPGPYTGTATGAYSYSVANADVQYLGANATKVDSFTLHSIDGTAKTVSFTIHGVNDAATITDDPNAAHHEVTEDSNVDGNGKLVAAGSLAVSDVDQGEAKFVATTTSGTYGAFSVDQNGLYKYLVDNASIQSMTGSDVRHESFHVTSVDGTGKDIAFTIHGADEPVSLTVGAGGFHANVTELINLFHQLPASLDTDSNPYNNNDPDFTHSRSGKFAISDSDANAAITVNVAADSHNAANMGSLVASVVDAPGGGKMVQWTFQVNDSQLDPLTANASAASQVQNFTLTIADSHGATTSTNVSINLFGTDEVSHVGITTGSGLITSLGGNERAFGSAGTDTYKLGSGNDIAFGEGTDNFIAQAGEKLVSFGGNGDNNDFGSEAGAVIQIGFGGSGSDSFSMDYGISEMHGNAGDDNFYFNAGDKNYAWGGQGTDYFNANGSSSGENWVMDFDTRSLANGGDEIYFNLDINKPVQLVAHTADANNPYLAEGQTYYDLTYGAAGSETTVLKIVGQNLDMDTLITNGNLVLHNNSHA